MKASLILLDFTLNKPIELPDRNLAAKGNINMQQKLLLFFNLRCKSLN